MAFREVSHHATPYSSRRAKPLRHAAATNSRPERRILPGLAGTTCDPAVTRTVFAARQREINAQTLEASPNGPTGPRWLRVLVKPPIRLPPLVVPNIDDRIHLDSLRRSNHANQRVWLLIGNKSAGQSRSYRYHGVTR